MKKVLVIFNLLTLLGVLAVNTLANTLPINDITTGKVSNNLPNLFAPDGITFAIWGVIYAMLIITVIYQLVLAFGKGDDPEGFINKINVFFIIANLANIVWIFLWHYQKIGFSVIAMVVLFLSLVILYQRLGIGKAEVGFRDKFLLHFPFSIYLSWITVATIANITAYLVKIGWNGFGISDATWTIIVLIVAGLITLLVLFIKRDYMYGLVIVWAFAGIMIKRMRPAFDTHINIVITAGIAAGLIFIISVIFIILDMVNRAKA